LSQVLFLPTFSSDSRQQHLRNCQSSSTVKIVAVGASSYFWFAARYDASAVFSFISIFTGRLDAIVIIRADESITRRYQPCNKVLVGCSVMSRDRGFAYTAAFE
jgi:hypothetical protein